MMHIPDSIRRAYEEELALIEPLRDRAGTRLRIAAADHGWLFDDRIKTLESCLSKLEAGHKSLRNMHDFYAAMLVVPTQKHIEAACQVVLDAVNGEVKLSDGADPSVFVYDDVHVIANLLGKVSPSAVPHSTVLERKFEIQIHTGVQYAWWSATHNEFYKGTNPHARSWAAKRASGQARASLELIDGLMGNFHVAAQLQRKSAPESDSREIASSWLSRWPPRARPTDEVRFIETVHALVTATGIPLNKVSDLIENGDLDVYVRDPSVTPAQAIIVACHLIDGDAIFPKLSGSGKRVLLTEELLGAYPSLSTAPEVMRVEV